MNKENIMAVFRFNDRGNYLNDASYTTISAVVDKILILYKLTTAELEAKVYTYEKIIANSNFAPILKEDKKLKKESKGE